MKKAILSIYFLSQIKVGPQLYILDLSRLNSKQRADLKSKNITDTISLTVPMTVISEVKDLK